jgi:hypothetical protein
MGTLYVAIPADAEVREWFQEMELPVPDDADGRLPEPTEVRGVLDQLEGYIVEHGEEEDEYTAFIHWKADSEAGPWALFAYPKETSDLPPERSSLTFRKGWPEPMVLLLHLLSKITGPFALVPDTGGDPLLVYSSADPVELLRSWEKEDASP